MKFLNFTCLTLLLLALCCCNLKKSNFNLNDLGVELQKIDGKSMKLVYLKNELINTEEYISYLSDINEYEKNVNRFTDFIKRNTQRISNQDINGFDVDLKIASWYYYETIKTNEDLGVFPNPKCLNSLINNFNLKYVTFEEKKFLADLILKIEFPDKKNIISNFDEDWDIVRDKYAKDIELGCNNCDVSLLTGNCLYYCYLDELRIVAETSLRKFKESNKIVFVELLDKENGDCISNNIFYEFSIHTEKGFIKNIDKKQINIPCKVFSFGININ